MEGVSEVVGQTFVVEIENIKLQLKPPVYDDFGYLESLLIANEPPLPEQAAAIAQFATSEADWSKDFCQRQYEKALERRRKIPSTEIISYAFEEIEGQVALITRLIRTQKPKGHESIEDIDIKTYVINLFLEGSEKAQDFFERLAESAGVSEAQNPTRPLADQG